MKRAFGDGFSGFAAATVEAWQELRIHRLRVLLSLIGVAVAVASITATVAVATIGEQVLVEQYEREGRPARIVVHGYDDRTGNPIPSERIRPAFEKVVEDFDITYASMRISEYEFKATYAGQQMNLDLAAVDPDYAAIHRVVVPEGRWLTEADGENLSPTVVVSPSLVKKLGLTDTPLPFTIDLTGRGTTVTATVVGIASRGGDSRRGQVYLHPDVHERWFGTTAPEVSYEMWVPVKGANQLAEEISRAMRAELPGLSVNAGREDYLAWGGEDPLGPVKWIVIGIAGIILLLGALSLLNIALVTIQQRIREIGIRRSFGATTGRVFFSVMMESVVATFVAGVVGVMLAVAAIKNPWVEKLVLQGIDDVPPFPLSAAFLGLAVALAVGALAGILPAMIAARVRIIDAIRF
ncbi:MAG: ABC transporter permease [Nocardioides sp.]|uniref:ABC transporter permease n=1 Tax=Nocardioides sp. TaxID=35761 RepID=UPI003D6BEFD7